MRKCWPERDAVADAALLLRERVRGISAGILAAPPGRLEEAAGDLARWGGRIAHFDVMDGCFVPTITAGPAFLAAAAGHLRDVHLMVARPAGQVDAFARAGADVLTVHAEAEDPAGAVLATRAAAARLGRPILAGVAVMPGTPLEALDPLLALGPDLVLVLAVDPRDGRPADVDRACARLALLRDRAAAGTLLALDGGITPATIDTAAACGPDLVVSGSAIFSAPDPAAVYAGLSGAWAAGRPTRTGRSGP